MRRFIDLTLAGMGAALLLIAVFMFGPMLETAFYPAYSKFKIASVEPLPDGQSRVQFQYSKYRQCDPQGFSWFIGEPGAAFRQLKVTADDYKGRSTARPIGDHMSEPYVIDARPDQLKDRAFAEIYSRCHPFWLTRSSIYP